MWKNFDRTAYSREEFASHVDKLKWIDWRPKGITLHNTAAPTLAQWAESGPKHDARITNLQSYYENELGWHAGPHLFISRTKINGFSNLLAPGVHSRCWNSTHIGIEMVGDYNAEPFNTGDGAMVRDNAVFALAILYRKLGLDPNALVFHKECHLDNHDCPGHLVVKSEVISRVQAQIGLLTQLPTISVPPPPTAKVDPAPIVTNIRRYTNITATEFGGVSDRQSSAYGGMVDPSVPGVALPFHFPKKRKVRVFHGDKSVEAWTVDVGPWNTNDQYWNKPDGRPASESQKRDRSKAQNNRVPSNDAGIDLTPATFKALGIPNVGMAKVDWEFID